MNQSFKPTTKTVRELIDFEAKVNSTIQDILGVSEREAELIIVDRDHAYLQCLADDLSVIDTANQILDLAGSLRNAA